MTKPIETKKVNAWAVLEGEKFLWITNKKPERREENNAKEYGMFYVPCTITYQLPTPKKRV